MHEETSLPITMNFDMQTPVGWVQYNLNMPAPPQLTNPQQYFLAPQAVKDPETGKWVVTGYGLVHISALPSVADMDQKYGKGNW